MMQDDNRELTIRRLEEQRVELGTIAFSLLTNGSGIRDRAIRTELNRLNEIMYTTIVNIRAIK